MKELDRWRKRIDEIDSELVRLLNERATCAAEIGEIKKEKGLPIEYPEREASILKRVCEENTGPLGNDVLAAFFRTVIENCKQLEE